MSGPKTSRYSLTLEMRRAMERARELERKTKAAYSQKESKRKEVMSLVSQLDKITERAEFISMQSDKNISSLQSALTLQKKAADFANSTVNSTVGSGLGVLTGEVSKLSDFERQLSRQVGVLSKQLSTAESEYKSELNDTISKGFTLSFDNIVFDNRATSAAKKDLYISKINDTLSEISSFKLTAELTEKLSVLKKKAAEIKSADFLENFYSLSVLPLFKKCKRYNTLYEEYGEEYERLIEEYKIIAEQLGEKTKSIPLSEKAISDLTAEISRLEAVLIADEEKAYISKCVDEVMLEMGYSLIGSREVTKRSGKHFTNELYLFDEGTAVNVTKSDNGQITMELGGLDSSDRLPDDSESRKLADEMTVFCNDYKKIEQKLREKGIVTNYISLLPPDEQYAQIINTNDYEMNSDVENFSAEEKGKQNISTNGVLRYGEV